jgi:hypothetical protein
MQPSDLEESQPLMGKLFSIPFAEKKPDANLPEGF